MNRMIIIFCMIMMSTLISSCAHPAVEIARKLCQDGGMDLPANADATVSEKGGNYIVTFPQKRDGGLHGDFYARVVIDKATGKQVGLLEYSQ